MSKLFFLNFNIVTEESFNIFEDLKHPFHWRQIYK